MSELFNGFGKLFETNNHGNGYFYEEDYKFFFYQYVSRQWQAQKKKLNLWQKKNFDKFNRYEC